MSKIELKPCPFCGCTAVQLGLYNGWNMVFGECKKCGALAKGDGKTKEDAANVWNRRADNG